MDPQQITQLLVSGGGIAALWLWNRQLIDTHKVDKEALNANVERLQIMVDNLHEQHVALIRECTACIQTLVKSVEAIQPCKFNASDIHH